MAKKIEISKCLIKIGFSLEELDGLIRICEAAMGFCEERSSKELYEKAETWEGNFKLIKKNAEKKKGDKN